MIEWLCYLDNNPHNVYCDEKNWVFRSMQPNLKLKYENIKMEQ